MKLFPISSEGVICEQLLVDNPLNYEQKLKTIDNNSPNYYVNMIEHLSLFKSIKKTSDEHQWSEHQWFLITEENASSISNDFSKEIEEIIKEKPKDAQVIQLYCRNPECYHRISEANLDNKMFVSRDISYLGTNAYIISKEGAEINLNIYYNDDVLNLTNNQYKTTIEDVIFNHLVDYMLNKSTLIIKV